MKIKRSSQKVKPTRGEDAWFYEAAKSIEVFIYPGPGQDSFSCRIPRDLLADYVQRTEPKKEKK